MKSRLLVVLSIFCLKLTAQDFVPCDSIKASLYCHEAPIICDIDCLDGFTDRMPDSLYTYGDPNLPNYPQPALLCKDLNTGSGSGSPNNMSWFAFIAGSTTINLEIIPSNCLQTDPNGFGLQAGIISGCQLDVDGEIPDSLRIDCIDTGPTNFTIGGDNFIPGQIYYFFIDGVAGTICDYTVDVIDGSQPFPLDEITGILGSNNELVDTLCAGQENVMLHPEVNPLNIDYYWKITPETPEFPDTFRNLSYTTTWDFKYPGEYEISIYATNGCDDTDTFTQNIIVELLPDEVFDSVDICFNDFPYVGPLTEDPNGDGVIGWLGPIIPYNGGDIIHNVALVNGCSYNQKIRVNEISPGQRVKVTELSCSPFDYHGTMINQTQLGIAVNIPGGTEDGCDSLVMLDAYIIDLEGDIQVINCDTSGLKIGFVLDNINAPVGYELFYKWFDSSGELIDDDLIGSDIIIDKVDSYSVQVSVVLNQDTCVFDIAPKIIDPDDNKPSITAVDWTLNICDSDNTGTYTVTSNQSSKIINWTIPAGAVYLDGNQNSEFIKVDFTNSGAGIVEVVVENYCSGTSTLSFPVEITTSPIADFNLPIQICKDSILVLQSNEPFNPDFQYLWKIPSNSIGGPLTNPGPIEIEFVNNSGFFDIDLIIANGNCKDSLTQTVELLEDISPLNIDCDESATSVTFTWDSEPCAESYTLLYDSQTIELGSALTYTIDDLELDSEVDIQLLINSNCLCSGPVTLASCKTLDCSNVQLDITPTQNFICEDLWSENLPTYINLSVDPTLGVLTWSGAYVDNNGVFNAIEAGVGTHTIFAIFEQDGCVYEDSTSYILYEKPEAELEIYDPQCIDELVGSLDINVSGGGGNYQYILDNTNTSNTIENIPVGEHTIQIIDGNSCQVLKTFTINPAPTIDYQIEGSTEIYESEPMHFLLEYTMSEVSLVDSIAWYLDGELVCSGLNCNSLFLENLTPGEYEHNVFIYYNDCLIEESFSLIVRESTEVYIPQIFSPNGDGANDFWFIATNDPLLNIANCSVYNRWGNKVFNKNNFSPYLEYELWDGRFNGKKVQPGVYVLSINYKDEFGKDQLITKDITIIY